MEGQSEAEWTTAAVLVALQAHDGASLRHGTALSAPLCVYAAACGDVHVPSLQ